MSGLLNKSGVIGRQIKAKKVFVVGADGVPIGQKSLDEALEIAANEGLDLVQVGNFDCDENACPPCRIMDYKKHIYLKKKGLKASDGASKNVIKKAKTIVVNLKIGQRDLDIRINQFQSFLEEMRPVKVIVRIRRKNEEGVVEKAKLIIEKFEEILEGIGKKVGEGSMSHLGFAVNFAPIKK